MIAVRGAVVCVTGGARGIGLATATALTRRGATVLIGDLDLAEARRAADRIGAHAHHLDVTDADSVADFHATVLQQLGLDHESLVYEHAGREETLTDPSLTGARVISGLLA